MKKQYVAPRIDLALVYALGQNVNTEMGEPSQPDAGKDDNGIDFGGLGNDPANGPAVGPTF